MNKPAALYLPGELTEHQYFVAQQFARLMHVMRDRLSAGMAAMEAAGLPFDVKACDKAYWLLADLETPAHAVMLEHIGACVEKQKRRAA